MILFQFFWRQLIQFLGFYATFCLESLPIFLVSTNIVLNHFGANVYFNSVIFFLYSFKPPLEVKPGDSLHVNCTYNTISATTPVLGGQGTFDEMCFGVMLVYPFDNTIPTQCASNNGMGRCGSQIIGNVGDCSGAKFVSDGSAKRAREILGAGNCDATGKSCESGCKEAIDRVYSEFFCFQEGRDRFMKMALSLSKQTDILLMLASCNQLERENNTPGKDDHDHDHEKGGGAAGKCVFNEEDGEKDCDGATCGASGLVASLLLFLVPLTIKL